MSRTTTCCCLGWDDDSWKILQQGMTKLEVAWQSTELPRLAEFLPVPGNDPRHTEMLGRLVELDQECRARAGIPKAFKEYTEEWPELTQWSGFSHGPRDNPLSWGPAEGQSTADSPHVRLVPAYGQQGNTSPQPWALRVLCPHCHNAVEIIDEDPLVPVDCPVCSSRFRLVDGGAPLEKTAEGHQQLRRRIAHFELVEQLGRGAFGSVWKAKDTTLDALVALKIPRVSHLGPDEAERFIREARAAAQLSHPNIVGVHLVGRDGDQLYIASELIDGVSLDTWKSNRQLSFKEVARLCATLAGALHYAHEHGVIHRDLKPQNIMVDGSGEPHLTDFGLAKREGGEVTMTVDGKLLGTPAYMSPEQARAGRTTRTAGLMFTRWAWCSLSCLRGRGHFGAGLTC